MAFEEGGAGAGGETDAPRRVTKFARASGDGRAEAAIADSLCPSRAACARTPWAWSRPC